MSVNKNSEYHDTSFNDSMCEFCRRGRWCGGGLYKGGGGLRPKVEAGRASQRVDSATGLRDRGGWLWLPVEVGGESRPGWWVNSICSSGPSRPVETVASTIQRRATEVSILLNLKF